VGGGALFQAHARAMVGGDAPPAPTLPLPLAPRHLPTPTPNPYSQPYFIPYSQAYSLPYSHRYSLPYSLPYTQASAGCTLSAARPAVAAGHR